ncbi:Suppressor of SWI4 1-like [Oopsacas minuta]|uniref:Suppressor of SWI4 1-like n=1 Tax=Oopsacas minuta TaxID=111878 RepID=A0AAV7JE81_9METZ|nr:Suppressor of SWI4 1-like [Oopsacas minuta]
MGLTRRKKKRTHISTEPGKKGDVGERAGNVLPDSVKKPPACFIIGRGQLNIYLQQLISDLKFVYEPNTASNLKTTKKNSLRDFLHVAGPLGVSHCIVLNFSGNAPTIRFARFPHGPTVTFKVLEYSLMRDVVSSQKRPKIIQDLHLNSPLLVLSQFNEQIVTENEDSIEPDSVKQITPRCLKLLSTMLQNMFPSLNVHNVKLKQVKRCVLFHYDAASNQIHLRHYCIKTSPQGIRKQVDRLARHKIPSLAKYDDISDYLMRENLSESEPDDLPEAQVILPQSLPGAGNKISQRSKIRLYELGPRLTLSLIKIQDSLFDGEVLYHMYVHKSKEEIAFMRKEKARIINEKTRRRKLQEANVRRKEEEKQIHRKRTLAGMRAHNQKDTEYSSDDDFEYYRQEVGEDPSNELLLSKAKRVKFDTNNGDFSDDEQSKRPNFRSGKSSFRGGKRDFGGAERKFHGGNKRNFHENGKVGRIDRHRGFKKSENGSQFRAKSYFQGREGSNFRDRKGRNNFTDSSARGGKFGNSNSAKEKYSKPRKAPGGRVFRVRKRN